MNDLLLYNQVTDSTIFHDLRREQDDVTILRNPHKGWYFHYSDNGLRFPFYRNTLKPDEDFSFLPGMNHLYLRFDWSDIEEEEGVYRWDKIDSIIERYAPLGFHFTFRMCCFEVNRPMIVYSTPKWVFDAGAKYEKIEYQVRSFFLSLGIGEPGKTYAAYEPHYGDPVFLEKLEKFIAEYGRHYNGNPLIDFIDVGTIGRWGEGAPTAPCDEATYKKHIDLHLRYFPDTTVIVNYGILNNQRQFGDNTHVALAEYCAAHGMGVRDDSYYCGWYSTSLGYDMNSAPTVFDKFWRTAPVDLESAHQQSIAELGTMADGGFRMLESMKTAHATYAGFHGDPYVWYQNRKAWHDYAANRLGYWYFIEGYELPEMTRGVSPVLTLYVTNRGFAPAYHRYEMRVTAIGADGRAFRIDADSSLADNRLWQPGELSKARIKLDASSLAVGSYRLYLGLWSDRQVLFGIQRDRQSEFGALLGEFSVTE